MAFKKLTAEQWIKEFGFKDEEGDIRKQNYGNLEDIACSKCGNRSAFRMFVSDRATVYDQSIDQDTDGRIEDSSNSHCSCYECTNSGVIEDFNIKGLDKLIGQIGKLENDTCDLVNIIPRLEENLVANPPTTAGWDTEGIKPIKPKKKKEKKNERKHTSAAGIS